MSLQYLITKFCGSKAYFRKLVVRAIEDVIVLFCIGVAIWALCAFAEVVLGSMGVL